MATIYFSGSISGGRADVELYRRIVARLEEEGHRVLAGMVTATHIHDGGESLRPSEIFDRDLAWLAEVAREGGLLVAEVSLPSHGVGYEIACARYRYGIRVIALYRPAHTRRCSAMISGDPGVRLIEYSEAAFDQMLQTLTSAIAHSRE